jgi:hypothetical protein
MTNDIVPTRGPIPAITPPIGTRAPPIIARTCPDTHFADTVVMQA